jgi:competence protein ComEC
MSAALALALLLLFSLLGSALAQALWQWLLVAGGLLMGGCWLVRHRSLSRVQACLLSVVLALSALRGGLGAQLQPNRLDPVHAIAPQGGIQVIEARLLADAPVRGVRCQALVQVRRVDGGRRHGRTELVLSPCQEPLRAGLLFRADGHLLRPAAASHPQFSSVAQRLQTRGSWTQFRTHQLQPLHQGWTPFADGRRRIESRLKTQAGERTGALMASLVLGGAQVELPPDLKQSFRVAGLSHALAASGFHLSVLLGAVLVVTRRSPVAMRLLAGVGAMLLFLVLAGPQPSVVRAVLMGLAALLIREQGSRSRPLGVLVLVLLLMLWIHPIWARSVGFQLSAAATAGLVITAPGLEQALAPLSRWPWPGLAAAMAVPIAAMAWTLPLQWLHFGAMPLYAVLANLVVAPLLTPLTLASMVLALLCLVVPQAVALPWLSLLVIPVKALAAVLITVVTGISAWPWAELLTGRPQPWLVLVLILALLPWWLPFQCRWRWRFSPLLLAVVLIHGALQLQDAVVRVEHWGRQWVLLRHRGRAALISSGGDGLSCHGARQLQRSYGHARLDWVVVLDPVATNQMACWTALAHWVQAEQQGLSALVWGQRVESPGLLLQPSDRRGRRYTGRAGGQMFRLRRRGFNLTSVERLQG